MDRLLERITQDPDAAASGYYFDVFSLHIYFRTDTVYDIVRQARALLDRYGLVDKRIWINETNAAPTDDPQWPVERPVYQLDLEQQAAFLVQAAALGLAAGAERIAVYKLYDQALPPGGESFGILSPADQQPRPAYTAWQTAARYFGDAISAERAQSAHADVVRLAHPNGRQTLVAWARTEADAGIEISATGDRAQLLDPYGTTALLLPENGVYRLTLPGARCNDVDGCAVGGPPLIFIQTAGVAAVRDVTESSVDLQFE
jgi:hypothetical protein